jgi:transcription-repair coupling factor (superfamily II helicase)
VTLAEAYRRIVSSPPFDRLVQAFDASLPVLRVQGAAGSVPALALTHLAQNAPLIVAITPDEDAALYLVGDLEQLAFERVPVLRLPPSGQKPYDDEHLGDVKPLVQRSDVLQQLEDGWRGILVVSAQALAEQVAERRAVRDESTRVAVGDTIEPAAFLERLDRQGFRRVEFVEAPGEMAVRGGLIDVFPWSGDYPIRIELFGDDVDSIREFDPSTQRSVSKLEAARLLPNLDLRQAGGPAAALFDYLPPDTRVATFDEPRALDAAGQCLVEAENAFAELDEARRASAPPPERLYLSESAIRSALERLPRLQFGITGEGGSESVHLHATPQPPFNAKLKPLRDDLEAKHGAGVQTIVLCDTAGQRSRLADLLERDLDKGIVDLQNASLHEGFVFEAAGVAVYTDHQIFNRYHRPTSRGSKRKVGGLSLRELQNLEPGDFVVHMDYGIGKFAGLETITVREKQQEAIRLIFQGGDKLYVNVNSLHKLSKFTGQEGHQPGLTKLGSGAWERSKAKTKKRVKDIARDLIALYAERVSSRGHAFGPDTLWQREMEAAFEYEDTPDQAEATEAVKGDMEQKVPMDRLVCGDVGFGKTEVAIRAAFKAVQDGKQVAVLVPTTILAQQHYETFSERLKGYPVRVEVISRFRTTGQAGQVLDAAKNGEVDILIGTHRIVSKDVGFKDLGLLIIDEEQRFGVAVKEKLRKLRASVDTLTLTATPIPRTLQFSLMGARDLSVIRTPPPNRQPIVTEIHTFDQRLIRDAILHETSRGGQVFFVHNRVQNIEEIATLVRAIVPGVRVQVAHGQMSAKDLEKVMHDFKDRAFDVLVATTIVESGVDIPNANTMIINNAQQFGLGAMHQLRGRVGRSDRKAYCYLLVPSVAGLTREAKQRLQAVEEFAELGSGFNIAMRDLDIRGAGNMLGAEQSGFVAELGFEAYQKILEEAVQELRHDEFGALFSDAPPPRPAETTLDVEEDALIPDAYVSNSVERLNLYRRIAESASSDDLAELRAELVDRFGPVPAEVDHLLLGAELRLMAQALRLARVQFKNQRLFLETPKPEDDPFFYEHTFEAFLKQCESLKRRYVLKDNNRKLRVIVQDVRTLQAARDVMQHLVKVAAAPLPEPAL